MTDRPRFLIARSFPPYAYLPGRYPHPVRDPEGHSHGLPAPKMHKGPLLASEDFLWGEDLFNHGYYWEAHEAWEGLWQIAEGNNKLFLKGLILLSASGVKVREGKREAALRHANRAAEVFLLISKRAQLELARAIGMTPSGAAMMSITAIEAAFKRNAHSLVPQAVFPFVLGKTGEVAAEV